MIRLFCAACLITIAACGLRTKDQHPLAVNFKGVRYVFPRAHVNASVIPPEGSRLYVRLAPPAAKFHLILDENSDRPSGHPDDVPHISRLTDRFGEFSVTPTTEGLVVCNLGPQPHFNCGFHVDDGGVKWAVLFDKPLMSEAAQIRQQAASNIASYRSDS